MDTPTTINILGIEYTIKEVDVIDKYVPKFGMIDYTTSEILIDKTLSSNKKIQTLIHEVMHGIFEGLGYDELNSDEEKVQSIATALHSVFGDRLNLLE
jgi:hypothetical protein